MYFHAHDARNWTNTCVRTFGITKAAKNRSKGTKGKRRKGLVSKIIIFKTMGIISKWDIANIECINFTQTKNTPGRRITQKTLYIAATYKTNIPFHPKSPKRSNSKDVIGSVWYSFWCKHVDLPIEFHSLVLSSIFTPYSEQILIWTVKTKINSNQL